MESKAPQLLKKIWRNEVYRRALSNYMIKGYMLRDRRYTLAAIDKIVRGDLTDVQMLKLIVDIVGINPCHESRPVDRARERTRMIKSLTTGLRVHRYLDYGCGDGTITQQIGKCFDLPRGNVIGIDVHHTDNPNITFLGTTINNNYPADGSIDLITAFVSLHHISDLDNALSRIYRWLRPGGLLIIREHDCGGDDSLRDYLNLIHAYLSVREYGDCDTDALYAGIKYRSFYEWDRILSSVGFSRVRHETYRTHNPQKLYYASYMKK